MTEAATVPETAPMSQGARVLNTFVAPSKTFADILRSAQCWLPIVLMFVIVFGWAAAIDKKVGYDVVTQNQMAKNPAQAERMQSMPEADRAHAMDMTAKITRAFTYGSIVLVALFWLIEALILWAAFNFGLGATTKFSQVFAVIAFSALPRALTWVVSAILLFAGVGTDNFDVRNPVGTNLGFYLNDSPKWMQTAGQFIDIFGLWSLALLVLGMAIISKKKIGASATIIVGLWLLILIISVGFAAAFG